MDRRNISIGYLPEVVEVIVWHLDAKTILRAKQVCHLWKKSVEHLERYKHLWRHVCLRDIYRPSLIDIIGFNPLSQNHKFDPLEGTEDLWRTVYRSWMAGQFLDQCKKSSLQLQCLELIHWMPIENFVQIDAYIYMLTVNQLLVWDINISNYIKYKQRINCSQMGPLYSYLKYPLCKFSQHQDLSQHSLIIPTANCIQWWAFLNGVFTLVQKLDVKFHFLRVWDNMLVTASSVSKGRSKITVFILEQNNNEFSFCKRNASALIGDIQGMTVWDNKCLVTKSSSLVMYDLDDFTELANISNFERPKKARIFGDFVIFMTTTYTEVDNEFYHTRKRGIRYEEPNVPAKSRAYWLCIFNVNTGEQFEVEVFENYVTDYKLHGDILIVAQPLLNKVHTCRINADESPKPVWCTDAYQNNDMDPQETASNVFNIVVPKVLESQHVNRHVNQYRVGYGESIVVQKDDFVVNQYICK